MHWRGKRDSFIVLTSPFFQDSTSQSQERPSWPMLLHWGKIRACVWASGFSGSVGCFQKGPLLSCPIQNAGLHCPGWAGRTGRTAASSVRGHQRTPSLLTTSQSPTRSLSMSFWASPHLAHRHPQCSERDTIALHLHPVPNSLSPTPKAARASLCRWLVSTCRKPAWVRGIGREHANLSFQHCWGEQTGGWQYLVRTQNQLQRLPSGNCLFIFCI